MSFERRPASVNDLIRLALDAALWQYREIVRRRMGMPESGESMRRVLALTEAQMAEYLNDAEVFRMREYRALKEMWDGLRPVPQDPPLVDGGRWVGYGRKGAAG